MFGKPGSAIDSQVPSRPDVGELSEDDEPDGEDEGDDGDGEGEELPPAALSARSDGAVGKSDVDLFVNWQPAAAIDQSATTTHRDRCLIPVLTHL
jgi:hypothetical protein